MKQAVYEFPDLDTIKEDIRRQKISQLSLARSSGVPQSVISRIMNGDIKDPSYNTVRKLLLAIWQIKNPQRISSNSQSNELMRTAQELMSKEIIAIKPHNKLADAWKIMTTKNFSQIPV